MTTLECVIVLTTWPVGNEPVDGFARALVEARVAACVNVLPEMRSVYAWQGAIEVADERQIVIKTSRDRLDALRNRLKALHPYDVPELLVLPVVEGNADYLTWVVESTRPPAQP